MCNVCHSRRRFLSAATLGAFLAGAGLPASATEAAAVTPDEALQKLKDGNAKFVAAPELCAADVQKTRETVAKGQHPYAVIVTCADSRVSPELLFGGVGLGELFVCRNAGNVADAAVMGSIEYAVEHLHAPLVVVLGHERCGAVAAAVDVVTKGASFPGFIGEMLEPVIPAVEAVKGKEGDIVDLAVIENARRMAEHIGSESKIVAEHVEAGKAKVVYGRYDLDTGAVELLGA